MGTWPPGLLSHRSTHELYVCYLWGYWQKGLGKSTKINVKLKSCFDLRLRIWFFSRKRAKMNDWINKNALVISIMFPPQKSRHFRCYSYGNITWRIPGTGDPGGLPSMGSHRVGQDWSDLAVAAALGNKKEKEKREGREGRKDRGREGGRKTTWEAPITKLV